MSEKREREAGMFREVNLPVAEAIVQDRMGETAELQCAVRGEHALSRAGITGAQHRARQGAGVPPPPELVHRQRPS